VWTEFRSLVVRRDIFQTETIASGLAIVAVFIVVSVVAIANKFVERS
jgi:hypothetical protein